MCEYLENNETAISSEFLTRRIVQECLATFGGRLGFERKMKKSEYLENHKR